MTLPEPPDNSALADMLAALLESRITCLGCAADRRRAENAGIPAEHLPTMNVAQLIIQGNGQTPTGLYIPGQH